MQEVEIKSFHVHEFVKEIVDRVKDGWEFKDFDSVHYAPQFVGSHYFTVMVKADDEASTPAESPVIEQSQEKKAPVGRRKQS